MASDQGFVDFVVDGLDSELGVTSRKMFGEYGLHSNGLFFALICDDHLFVKPTPGGRAHIGNPTEAPPYPGAKPYLRIDDRLEDRHWLSELIRITARELPPPKPKKKPKKKASKTGGAKDA